MKIVLALIAVTIVLVACNSATSQGASYKNVDVAGAKAMVTSDKSVVYLDVRTPGEIANGSIEGALKIDINGGSFADEIAKLDKETPYIVYCKSGGRSVKACKKMSKAGFTNLTNMKGGYTAWTKE